jgi:hypothetical protein
LGEVPISLFVTGAHVLHCAALGSHENFTLRRKKFGGGCNFVLKQPQRVKRLSGAHLDK